MNLQLDPEIEKFIASKVESGEYAAPSEVIRAAIALMKEQEVIANAQLDELRKEIAIGIEDIERGDVAPWDVEAIKAAARQRRDAGVRKVI
jgi:antitoxin ParD1/3/4